MSARVFLSVVVAGGLGTALFAQAQSPFATKKKKQAWEVEAQNQNDQTSSYQAPSYHAPAYQSPTYQTPSVQALQNTAVATPLSPTAPSVSVPSAPLAGGHYQPATPTTQLPQTSYQAPSLAISKPKADYGQYNPQNTVSPLSSQPQTQIKTQPHSSYGTYQTQAAPVQDSSAPATTRNYQNYYNEDVPSYMGYPRSDQRYDLQGRPILDSYYNAPSNNQSHSQSHSQAQPGSRSWKDRLGLGNIATTLSGFLKFGAGAVHRKNDRLDTSDWGDGYIIDGRVRGEASAITQNGLEYGAGVLVRGQYDEFRRGFGGRVGDCPPNIVGCPSVDIDGALTAIRGHTSRFYTSGADDAKATEFQLEGAYAFLRSAYGDVTVGRDDGAAYLFSLGAPSLVAVNASNSPVDYTCLLYTSPSPRDA